MTAGGRGPGAPEAFWDELRQAFARRLGVALADAVARALQSAWRAATGDGASPAPTVSSLAVAKYLDPASPFSGLSARQVEAWAGSRLMAMSPEQREAVVAAAAGAADGDGQATLREIVRILHQQP